MRISTVNVNGIRAAARKGMAEWIAERQPDVILLQEVRAEPELVDPLLPGYTVITEACAIKGRAGVAVAVREGIDAVELGRGVGTDAPVDTGRWLEVGLPGGLTVVSTYIHSGVAGTEKMDMKYAHLEAVTRRLDELASDGGDRKVLVAGDFNIVRGPLDITNFKPNHNKTSGVLDPEIAYLDRWFATWRDVHRELSGDVQGPYTWWSNRGRAFENNVGWRIDYQMAAPALADLASNAVVDRATSYETRWSDHAPLTVEYSI
ncbi:MAG: exodeoxyribonuclease III [Ruaniaceae bacterium]|nr:exodeoxyribonuclease III [Ruaniaceae bacterium]